MIWFDNLSTTFVNITLQQSNEDPWTLKTNLKLVSSQLHLKYLERDAADWSGTTATHAPTQPVPTFEVVGLVTGVWYPHKRSSVGASFVGKLLKSVLTDDDVDGEGGLIRAARVDGKVGSIIHAGGSVFHSRSSFQLTRWRVHTRLQNQTSSASIHLS